VSTGQHPNFRPGSETEAGVVDLIRRLTDDSKRLAGNEVRLAKLEMAEHIRTGGRGAVELGVAFGAAVVAATALTVFFIALLARATGRLWIGALVIGVVEALVGYLLARRGASVLGSTSYSLPETRQSLAETEQWAAAPRGD
jgi:hypothetical protein